MNELKQFESIDNGLLIRAPAKINLSLLIAGKRPDGFHEIETLMAKINFYDEILIQQSQKTGIELICKGPYWAPQGKKNLVYQAAESLLDSCQQNAIPAKAGIEITLTKNIPAGSGLGSASSDAAAALLGLNKLLQLNLSTEDLNKIAAVLGSDVPFFLDGPLAFCTGRGEKIKKINKNFNFLALLVLPDVTISTKKIYANYKHNKSLYKNLKNQINEHIRKNRFDLISKICANMLQTDCFRLYKELTVLNTRIESSCFGPLCLSGSGSAMFYIIDSGDEEKAKQYQRKLEEKIGCKNIIVSNNKW